MRLTLGFGVFVTNVGVNQFATETADLDGVLEGVLVGVRVRVRVLVGLGVLVTLFVGVLL